MFYGNLHNHHHVKPVNWLRVVKVAPQGDSPVPSWPQPRSQTATLKIFHFEIKDQSPGKNKSCKYWVKLCRFANLRKLHLEETSRFNDKIQNAKRKNTITGKAPKCLSTLQLLTTIKFGISSPNMTWKEIAYLFHFDDTFDDTRD